MAVLRAFRSANRARSLPLGWVYRQTYRHRPFARNSSSFIPPKSGITAGRLFLAVAFTSTLSYLLGLADAGSYFRSTGSRTESPAYATSSEISKAISELQQVLGEDSVSTDEDELHRHGFSQWSFANADQMPWAIVYPRSTEEVSHIAKICSKYRIPMIPYSAGSSLEGHTSTPHGGVTIDFAMMDKILALHADDLDVVVQPAVPWMTLNEQLKPEGLWLPVDPGPTAQIGGMVATSCSGTNAVRWGTMRDWVINLTVVLADGTIIKTRRRPRKSSAGYNLTNLFVGSEGTLGIVTEITLKLAVVPRETSVAVVDFPSMKSAASAAIQIVRSGVPVAAMEIMDDVQMRVTNKANPLKKKWREVPTMFFKFSGTDAGVRDSINIVKEISERNGCGAFEFALDAKEKDELWAARKEALWNIMAMKDDEGQTVLGTDVAVPLSRLPDLIEVTKRDLEALGFFGCAIGHIGDGNFHAAIIYRPHDPTEKATVAKLVQNMTDSALEMEGTCTGEHGVGIHKKEALIRELGHDTVNTMKMIKKALDPQWLLNPGKVVDLTVAQP